MKLPSWLFLSLYFLLLGTQTCNAVNTPVIVGVIFSSDSSYYRTTFHHFSQELTALGYGVDQLKLFVQKPHPDIYSWANSARRAEATGAAALVTLGTPATRISLQETTNVPIVFSAAFSPLETSLEPLQNVSTRALRDALGIYSRVPVATLIKSYSETLGPASLTAIFHENDLDAPYLLEQLREAAAIYGLNVQSLFLKDRHFEGHMREQVHLSDGYFVFQGTFSEYQFDRISQLINTRKRPFISCGFGLPGKDSLISLDADPREQGIIAARKLVNILEGESPPATVNIAVPRNVSLTLNVQVARSLGIKIPFQVLASATRIISQPDN